MQRLPWSTLVHFGTRLNIQKVSNIPKWGWLHCKHLVMNFSSEKCNCWSECKSLWNFDALRAVFLIELLIRNWIIWIRLLFCQFETYKNHDFSLFVWWIGFLLAGYPQSDIDLGVVRLCYQAFLPDNNKRFTRILRPLVSAQIFDKSKLVWLPQVISEFWYKMLNHKMERII